MVDVELEIFWVSLELDELELILMIILELLESGLLWVEFWLAASGLDYFVELLIVLLFVSLIVRLFVALVALVGLLIN